jgi:hypothetical protein
MLGDAGAHGIGARPDGAGATTQRPGARAESRLRRAEAEQHATLVEALHPDGRPRDRGPVLAREPEQHLELRHPAHELRAHAVAGVAQLLGDPDRPMVEGERRRDRLCAAEVVEGQGEHGGAHLGADPLPLAMPRDPRARAGDAQHGKVIGRQLLDPDRFAVPPHDERQRPGVGCPSGPLLPEVAGEAARRLLLRTLGPAVRERHLARVVDPAQLRKVVVGEHREADTRRLEPQPEDGPDPPQRDLGRIVY